MSTIINSKKQDYLWNTLGVFIQNAISPTLLIAVTRTNGIYESGILSYALATSFIFWAFAIWGGRTYQVSDLNKEFSAHGYVMVRILLGIAVLFVSILFCFVNEYDSFKTTIIIVFVAFKITESIADAIYGVMQSHGKLFIAGRSLFLKNSIGAIVFIAVNFIFKDMFLASTSLLAVNIIVFMLYDLYHSRRVGYHISGILGDIYRYVHEAVDIIRRCAPIAAVLFLSMFSLNIPRYFLDKYHAEDLGYFGILVMPITALALVVTFLLQPKIIGLSRLFNIQKYQSFNKAVTWIGWAVILIGLIGLIISYIAGAPILSFIFNLDFYNYKSELMLIMIGAVASGVVSVYISIFTIMRHFKALFYTLIVTNIGLLAVSVYVVSEHGLLGATGLFVAVSIVQSFVLLFYFKILMRRYVNQLNII